MSYGLKRSLHRETETEPCQKVSKKMESTRHCMPMFVFDILKGTLLTLNDIEKNELLIWMITITDATRNFDDIGSNLTNDDKSYMDVVENLRMCNMEKTRDWLCKDKNGQEFNRLQPVNCMPKIVFEALKKTLLVLKRCDDVETFITWMLDVTIAGRKYDDYDDDGLHWIYLEEDDKSYEYIILGQLMSGNVEETRDFFCE